MEESFHRVGYVAPEVFDDHPCRADDALRLVAVEAGAADFLLEHCRVRIRVVLGGLVLLEQGGCNHVDAFVRALRRKDGGDKELERVLVVQRDRGVREPFGQELADGRAIR